jgi:ribosome-binding protein aMBF1 (putative translation factor)
LPGEVSNLDSRWAAAAGQGLATAREVAGLTQRQLAVKLRRSNSFVWKLEAGERQVNVLEFLEISRTQVSQLPS